MITETLNNKESELNLVFLKLYEIFLRDVYKNGQTQ